MVQMVQRISIKKFLLEYAFFQEKFKENGGTSEKTHPGKERKEKDLQVANAAMQMYKSKAYFQVFVLYKAAQNLPQSLQALSSFSHNTSDDSWGRTILLQIKAD